DGGSQNEKPTHVEKVVAEVREEPPPARLRWFDLKGERCPPFVWSSAKQLLGRTVADDPPDDDGHDQAEAEAPEDHRPQRGSPAVGDEGRCDDDRIEDGGGKHERHGRRGQEALGNQPSSDGDRSTLADREGDALGVDESNGDRAECERCPDGQPGSERDGLRRLSSLVRVRHQQYLAKETANPWNESSMMRRPRPSVTCMSA